MGKSQELYNKAKKIIPGGTQLLSKRPEQFLPNLWPAYFEKAEGCKVWDLDGKAYYDMSYMGIGSCILGYKDKVVDEAVKIVIDKGVLSLISGNRGFGQITATFGIKTAIEKAEQYGIGIIGLRDTNHIGRVGEYVLKASDKGFVGLSFCNAGPNVAPYGAKTKLFGTNPISCAVPVKNGKPILVDLATSIFPEGKVKAYNNRGELLPQEIVIDKNGCPSSIPQDLYDGGALLPIGEHKGSALSFMVEVLGGILTGAGSPAFSDWQGGNGVLFIVIDPTIFRSQDDFFKDIERIKKSVKSQPCAAGFDEILLPGEPEYKSEADRRKNGIPIDEGTWGKICAIAEKYGVVIPEPIRTENLG